MKSKCSGSDIFPGIDEIKIICTILPSHLMYMKLLNDIKLNTYTLYKLKDNAWIELNLLNKK